MAANGFLSSILPSALGGGGVIIVGLATLYLFFGSSLASVGQLEDDVQSIKAMIEAEKLVSGSVMEAKLETINTRIDAIEKRLETVEKLLKEIRDKI